MKCTVVREGNDLFVRYEMICDSEPKLAIGYWPISQDRSVGAHRLIGCIVKDDSYGGVFGVFSITPGIEGQDYWSLRHFRAVLMNGGKTEASKIEYRPILPPKVRKGIEVRWYQGRWQKLLKSGWVNA